MKLLLILNSTQCWYVCVAEADSGSKHYCVGGFHSRGRTYWTAVGSDSRSRVDRSVLLGVPVGDWCPWLPHGMGQCNADQCNITGVASHLVKL